MSVATAVGPSLLLATSPLAASVLPRGRRRPAGCVSGSTTGCSLGRRISASRPGSTAPRKPVLDRPDRRRWSSIAPEKTRRPGSKHRSGPPGYEWRNARRRGTGSERRRPARPVHRLLGAAPGRKAGSRPPEADPGIWEPPADAYEQFAQALATRYDGSFPDPPMPGRALPRSTTSRPGTSRTSTPTSARSGRRRKPRADLYRGLLNGFYAGVKAAQPGATVLGRRLAPFGDDPAGRGPAGPLPAQPALPRRRGADPAACPEPAHFDVLSDHPIAVGAPTSRRPARST